MPMISDMMRRPVSTWASQPKAVPVPVVIAPIIPLKSGLIALIIGVFLRQFGEALECGLDDFVVTAVANVGNGDLSHDLDGLFRRHVVKGIHLV